ncbi:MAG TPA: hypothetical protein VD859_02795 [Nocardioides sp.]|nr:hypothetical protein [Nocardioides sp.]
MDRLTAHLLALLLVVAHPARRRDDRGDVPGWVLVTVMTVGIVTGIWTFAQPELVGMVRQALNSVR